MEPRIGILLVFSGVLLGQYGNTCEDREAYARLRISTDIEQYPSCVVAGDAAAVAIQTVTKSVSIDNQITLRILRTLELAFSYPEKLGSAADREPRETLLLLNRLDALTMDAELKNRIVVARDSILGRVKRAAAKDGSACPTANYSLAVHDRGVDSVYTVLRPMFAAQGAPDQVAIQVLGDRVAQPLNAIIGGCKLNLADTQKVLAIIRGAFSHTEPLWRQHTDSPADVFALLDGLESSTKDPDVRAGIEETRSYVFSQVGVQ